jgi:hypothetical protein
MVISCLVVLGVLLSVLYHLTLRELDWDADQVTNIVLLLISTSAGVTTLIVQREFGGVAARMVSRLRAVGAISASLPILAAGFLAYATYPVRSSPELSETRWALAVLCVLASAVAAIAVVAWSRSRRSSLHSVVEESPWDMTIARPRRQPATNFNQALKDYGFESPAVAIRSAEGWHESYGWTDELQDRVTRQLGALGRAMPKGHFVACDIAGRPCPKTQLVEFDGLLPRGRQVLGPQED